MVKCPEFVNFAMPGGDAVLNLDPRVRHRHLLTLASRIFIMSKRRYKISIEDESRLQSLASIEMTPVGIAFSLLAILIFILFTGYIFILITPAKYLIPGYLRESDRYLSEEAILRVDSLRQANRQNQAFIQNMLTILNSDRIPVDSMNAVSRIMIPASEEIISTSNEELNFLKKMQQKEKFNISVQSTLAAEGMLFYPVSDVGIQSADSRDKLKAVIVLPDRSPVMALADGVVIAEIRDLRDNKNSLIIQHENGFISRYSGLGSMLIGEGDLVSGGEILAFSPVAVSSRPTSVTVQIWHSGQALKPFEYINSHRQLPASRTISSQLPNSEDSQESLGEQTQELPQQ